MTDAIRKTDTGITSIGVSRTCGRGVLPGGPLRDNIRKPIRDCRTQRTYNVIDRNNDTDSGCSCFRRESLAWCRWRTSCEGKKRSPKRTGTRGCSPRTTSASCSCARGTLLTPRCERGASTSAGHTLASAWLNKEERLAASDVAQAKRLASSCRIYCLSFLTTNPGRSPCSRNRELHFRSKTDNNRQQSCEQHPVKNTSRRTKEARGCRHYIVEEFGLRSIRTKDY